MNTREPRDYQHSASPTHNQLQRQAEFPATNTSTGREKMAPTSSPAISPLKRSPLHGIKVWHFIVLVLIIDVGLFGQAFWQEFANNTTQAGSHAIGAKLAPTSPSTKPANNNQQLTNDTNYKQLA